MGRVTVFVSDECIDSQLVRKLLLKYAIPFQEINVDRYPLRRAVMIQLTNCLTTPQVFFNKKYIGDSGSLASILKRYEQNTQTALYPTVLERISREVLTESMSPEDKKMFRITATEEYAAMNCPCNDKLDRTRIYDFVQVTEKLESNIGKISRELLNFLPRRNTSRFIAAFKKPMSLKSYQSLPVYYDYFSGKEAIKTFMKHYNLPSSDHAVTLGQKLLSLGIIHRIGIMSNFFSPKGFFRLQPLQSPKILNSFRVWTKASGRDHLSPDPKPIMTLSHLLQQMAEIITSATNDAGIVDYDAAQKNSRFRQFEESVCQLQLTDLKDMDANTRKTFFINVYNLMKKHTLIKLCPKKVEKGMFTDVHYNVGGFLFNLEDIYHGILRRNAMHPISKIKMFSQSDPRASFSLQEEDARIHFALNDRNNAVLYEYHVDAIDEELRIAAELYCKSNERVYISGRENKVIFPKFMKILLSDFTVNGDTHSFLEAIAKYFTMDRCRLVELKNMLERENANDERVTVLFKDKLSPPRNKMLRKLFSRILLLKQSNYSKFEDFEKIARNLENNSTNLENNSTSLENYSTNLPLQHINIEHADKWDSTSELSFKMTEVKGELKCPIKVLGDCKEPSSTSKQPFCLDTSNDDEIVNSKSAKISRSKLAYPSYHKQNHNTKLEHQSQIIASQDSDYSISDQSSSLISFDIGSKANVSIFDHEDDKSTNKTLGCKPPNQVHTRTIRPDHLLQRTPSEFTFSDIPDDYTMDNRSIINVPLQSNVDSRSGLKTSEIPCTNKAVEDADSLYRNANNESAIQILKEQISNQLCKHNTEAEHDEWVFSDIDDYSIRTKFTLSASEIPGMNEVNMELESLFNSLFPRKSV